MLGGTVKGGRSYFLSRFVCTTVKGGLKSPQRATLRCINNTHARSSYRTWVIVFLRSVLEKGSGWSSLFSLLLVLLAPPMFQEILRRLAYNLR